MVNSEIRSNNSTVASPAGVFQTSSEFFEHIDDEGDTTCEFSGHGSHKVEDMDSSQKEITIAKHETMWVLRSRITLVLVLVLVAGAICGSVFWFASKTEQENFESSYHELADKVADAFQANAARRVGAIESLAVTFASEAKAMGMHWPNVTIPDYEHRMSYALDLAEVISIIFIPIVAQATRKGWEEYSVQNQDWFLDGLALQQDANLVSPELAQEEQSSIDILEKTWGWSPDSTVPEEIFRVNGTAAEAETSDGPYAPWWQFAPVFPVPNLVNYNALSHPSRNPSITAMLETEKILVSSAWDYSDTSNPKTIGKYAALNLFLNRRKDIMLNYQDGPVSDLYVPIFETNSDFFKHLYHRKVVGFMTAYIYWQVYFHKILPHGTKEILVVLENSCFQQYTYSIVGEEATYKGSGDLHDPKLDGMEVTTGWHAFLGGSGDPTRYTDGGQCIYKLRIYPSKEMENSYKTQTPLYFVLILATAFIFTSILFVIYDKAVEKRNTVVMKQAVQSTEVFNTLYPEAVRDRIFEGVGQHSSDPNRKQSMNSNSDVESAGPNGNKDDCIADFYPNATILFADLVGFTEWSDQRAPKDVFLLLETLYGAFDKIAKRRSVFKVETIGDCYLAATGVPHSDEKHALTMVRFASDIISRMKILIQAQLVSSLGEDTEKLQVRVGIHSGSVTAGVLRGDRARFQLFGDSVNTASRLESNGIAGRIHVSESTARLLIEAGKAGWLLEREGGIDAKGKGHLRSFWVQPRLRSLTGRGSSLSESSSEEQETLEKSSSHLSHSSSDQS